MFAPKPGIIILLGSGETLPSSGKIHDAVARRLPDNPRIVILETPAGFEPNSSSVAGKIKQFLQQRLQNYEPQIEVLPARHRGTPFSPDNPALLAPILEADEILLGPGSPTYCVRQLQDSLALQMIAARQRLGASLFLSSAATIAFGTYALPVYEIYKVGEDLHWKPGLDYFSYYGLALSIIPHWNNRDGGEELDTSRCYVGRERFQRLQAMLSTNHTMVGIDEHTALLIDFAAGNCHVQGSGSATLLRGGQVQTVPTGSTLPLHELGPWRIPDGHPGVTDSVWERALRAKTRREAARRKSPKPPPAVRALLQERAEARAARDWAKADALRDQITALGWEIMDTGEGSELFQRTD